MQYQFLDSSEKYSTLATQEKGRKPIDIKQAWEVGQIIDERYEIQDILARDERKIIHKVRHCQWNIPLAVRSQLEKETQVRFFHQAERWVELGKHPNVVSAYYVQHIGGVPRLFVEYVTNARTLEQFIASEKEIDVEMVLDIAIQIGWGMEHAHKKGLLHGDLRPGNVFITQDGEVKISDFRSREDVTAVYTPYMPPEQFEKDWPAQPAIDIYAFGALLYELCVGEKPFKFDESLPENEWFQAFHNMVLTQPPQAPHNVNPKIPAELSRLVQWCISPEYQNRPKEFSIIIEKLQEIYLNSTGFSYPRESPEESSLLAIDLNNRAISLLDLGEEDKAEEYLEEAIRHDPHCTGAVINLYLLGLKCKKNTLAQFLAGTQSLLELDPEVVTFYRGKICMELGGFLEEALEEVRDAVKRFPQNKELMYLKGTLLERLGHCEEAVSCFEELCNQELPLKKCLYHLGCCYLEEGHKKKALEAWEKALALHPEDVYLSLGQGITLAMQGKLEEAYNHFHKNVSSEYFWTLMHLAEITAALGIYVKPYKKATSNKVEASRLYEKLLKLSHKLPRVIRGYEMIFQMHPDIGSSERYIPADKEKTVSPQWSYARSFPGHDSGIHCLSLSPDSRFIVAGGGDETIKIWEIETGKCKNVLQAHREGTTQVVISYDGHFAVSIGRDNTALVWDLISGECVSRLEGHVRDITSIAITCTGYLITGSLDKTLRIWDLGALSCRKILRGHADKINSVAVTPSGRLAISASEDGRVGIWEIEQGLPIHFLEGHVDGATILAVSPDGEWLATGSWDHKIRLFEMSSGNCTAVLEGHKGTINCMVITPDNSKLISGSEDKTIRIWELKSAKALHVLSGHTVDVTCLSVFPNGLYVISGSWDNTIRIWDIQEGQCVSVLEGHTGLVNSVVVTNDERYIVSGGDDSTLRVWGDLSMLTCPVFPESHLSYLLQIPRSKHANFEIQRKVEKMIAQAQSKCQEQQLAGAMEIYREIQKIEGFQDNPRVLDLIHQTSHRKKLARKKPFRIWKHSLLQGHTAYVMDIAKSDEEGLFVSASKDHTLKIWKIDSGECLYTLKGHAGPVSCIDISPNHRFLVSGSHDRTLRLWEMETGRCIHSMEGHENWVEHVKFTPDGRRVLSGSRDGTLRIWERKTGHRLYSLNSHTDLISDLKISQDARYIISSSHDRSVRVWELESGHCLHNLERHSEHVRCFSCVVDKPMIVSGGWDATIYLWDIERGEHIRTFLGHDNWINHVLVTPNGKRIVSCSLDKTLKVWEIDSGDCLMTLKGHTQDVNYALLTGDGRFCISSSWDRTIRVWDLETGECTDILEGHSSEISFLQSMHDMRYLISGGRDGSIVVWQMDWDWEGY